MKVINIVDREGILIASISEKNIILHKDYKVIETNESEACLQDWDGNIKLVRPEVSV
ncbi:hypothetical protein [Pueribacillus sp. YX66]|uniref:hypothetical protein n=1 Tax=Pueribacillus sp. YX66 TaxID=3229242 RepID=UPI00358D1902